MCMNQHFLIWRHRNSFRVNKIIWKFNFITLIIVLNKLLRKTHNFLGRVLTRLRFILKLCQATQWDVFSLSLEHWILSFKIINLCDSFLLLSLDFINTLLIIKLIQIRWGWFNADLELLYSRSSIISIWNFVLLSHILFDYSLRWLLGLYTTFYAFFIYLWLILTHSIIICWWK